MLIEFKQYKRKAVPGNWGTDEEKARRQADADVQNNAPPRSVFINPRYVVSVIGAYGKLYEGCTCITTCARESEEENESWIVYGNLLGVVELLRSDHSL